jgi:hypothetical protein
MRVIRTPSGAERRHGEHTCHVALIPNAIAEGTDEWGPLGFPRAKREVTRVMRLPALGRSAGLIALVYALLLQPAAAEGNVLVNPGFESTTPVPEMPTGYGYWAGDLCEFVPVQQGIEPYEGNRMLHLIATAAYDPGPNTHCQVYQLVDLAQYSEAVLNGCAVAFAGATFNRIAGDSETDTHFYCDIRAMSGAPSSFASQINNYVGYAYGGVYSDGDSGTWESVDAELVIPPEADYLGIGVCASENIRNNSTLPEFDGHYGDAAWLVIEVWGSVPEGATVPSTWTRIKALFGGI